MTKKQLKLLEKVFAAEAYNQLPFPSKSIEYRKLEADGMVEEVTDIRHLRDGLPPMRVTGWVLTHRGRIIYCQACADGIIK